MSQLHILFEPKSGKMTLTVNNQNLEIDAFLTDANGVQVRTLSVDDQKQVAKLLMQNILK